MRLAGHRISFASVMTGRFWRIGLLTTAGVMGLAAPADAALYFWQGSDPSYYQPAPSYPPRRNKVRRPQARKDATAGKQAAAKPRGSLIIAISIERQKVRIYDADGLFAESPVSTGMPGHSTPKGVFSVIQKHKFHRSNIYSGAPMPYMQRITWSGVAMHAGVLPGYPASHGCIRMPMAFAVKMWNWTKMGARVIVIPGEITPASFSHPLLVTQKVVPQPVAADEPNVDAPLGVKTDKRADAGGATKPTTSVAEIELKSTLGHSEPAAQDQTRTADAGSALPGSKPPLTMSDANISTAPQVAGSADSATDASHSQAEPQDQSSPVSKVSAAPAPDMPAETGTTANDAPAQAGDNAAGTEATTGTTATTEVKPAEAKAEAAARTTQAPKADTDESKPAEPTSAVSDAPSPATDAKKDTTRLPGVAKPELPKRTGQIAAFISRKDSKLYVRQNFAPLFDVPVTIVPSDRPLGTHVFTAEVDDKDVNLLRWSVVSLPINGRYAARNEDDDHRSRRRNAMAEAASPPLPNSPAEALDRITIPPEAMARIAEALTSGGSIIVSDQGINQGETGEGTDFIVSMR